MFDRIAICAAYHLVASHYHSGQWSKGYLILDRLDRLGFRPSPLSPAKGSDTRNDAATLIWKRRSEIRREW